MKRLTQFLALILIGIFSLTPMALAADFYQAQKPKTPDTNVMAADALIGRPVGLGATVLGTGAFVATLPFTMFTGSVKDAARGLIKEPAHWTFRRPLGEPPQKKSTFIIR